MEGPIRDARLDELTFLTKLARIDGQGWTMLQFPEDTPERRMVVQLLLDGCLNGAGSTTWTYQMRDYPDDLAKEITTRHFATMAYVLAGQEAKITIAHRGRVRIAELAQALVTGRQRDPTGKVWSVRHRDTDLELAIRRSNETAPAAFAILDMNGLKKINDERGHGAGDRAIAAYLQTIASALPVGFDAYRGDGGDEAYVVIQSGLAADAEGVLVSMLRSLEAQAFADLPKLHASCGLVVSEGPNDAPETLRERADQAQYRAKALAREHDGKPSAIAIGDSPARLITPPTLS